jgi:hypothetical protein
MAESILAALDHPPAREVLMRRAAEFDLAHAMDRYVPLLLGETPVQGRQEPVRGSISPPG